MELLEQVYSASTNLKLLLPVSGRYSHMIKASFVDCLRWHRALLCRQLDDTSHKKLEKLFDMAMSDPLNDEEAQLRALIRAKNKVRSPNAAALKLSLPQVRRTKFALSYAKS